jgi:hypothetical protein
MKEMDIKEPVTIKMVVNHCWILIELLQKNPYVHLKSKEIDVFVS